MKEYCYGCGYSYPDATDKPCTECKDGNKYKSARQGNFTVCKKCRAVHGHYPTMKTAAEISLNEDLEDVCRISALNWLRWKGQQT